MQGVLDQFIQQLGVVSARHRQTQLPHQARWPDGVDREREWVTFAQELYSRQGVGLIHFDRVADFFSRFSDNEDFEWIINMPFPAYEGRNVIHLVTLNRQNALLNVLLTMGGSPNVPDSNYQTAVHHAALNRDSQSLQVLLNQGGDLHQLDINQKTPWDYVKGNMHCEQMIDQHLATLYGLNHVDRESVGIIKSIHESLNQGCDVKTVSKLCSQLKVANTNHVYLASLLRACRRGQKEMAMFLLNKMKHPFNLICPFTNETPLHAACEGNSYDIVLELVRRHHHLLLVKDNLPHRSWYPLHTACAFGASDGILGILLTGIVILYINQREQKIDNFSNTSFLDAFGRSPLYIAVRCENSSHVSLMTHPLLNLLYQCAPSLFSLTSGALPSGISAVHAAITQSNHGLLCKLLDSFPQAKHVLACPSKLALRQVLNSLSVQNSYGVTIHESKNGELILAPLNSTSPLTIPFNNIRMSPLALAAALGDEQTAETLLQVGVSDDDGLAVRFAQFTKHPNIVVKILLQQQRLGSSEEDFVADSINLSSFPMSNFVLRHISQFTKIHLQNNQLSVIPLEIFQLPELKMLNLSHNKLTDLPTEFKGVNGNSWNCPQLKLLDVSHNELQSIPSALWKLPSLKHLIAHHNHVSNIRNTVLMTSLETIDFSHNKLADIPIFFTLIKDVTVSDNELTSLPEEIWHSKVIVNFNASSNCISEINLPQTDDAFKRGESFTSQTRKVSGSDSGVDDSIEVARRKSLYTVSVNKRTSLLKLKLSDNQLKSFPTALACFVPHLQELDVSNNKLDSIDIRILPPHLKSLYAKRCSIQEFGFLDGDIINVCSLNGGPCFHKIHLTLEALHTLNLAGNKLANISVFSEETERLLYPNLQVLDLSSNLLSGEFAPNIEMLGKLQSLHLANNTYLTSLSMKLSQLSKTLFLLDLNHLPNLRDPPVEYRKCPLAKTFSYMKSRLKRSVKYNTIKLIVVGSIDKGKTTLIKRLTKRGPTFKKPVSHCKLVDMNVWSYAATSDTTVKFITLDFTGKKAYHGIPHWFYSKQAIYLVVFSLADGENGVQELDMWLRNVKSYAPGAPVILVGNHVDQITTVRANSLSSRVMTRYSDKRSYPTIVNICCVNSTAVVTPSHMNILRKQIYEVATCLYVVNGKMRYKLGKEDSSDLLLQLMVPESYLKLQEAIKRKVIEMKESERPPILKAEEFFRCFLSLMEDAEELSEAVQFLHSENVILHFTDPLLISFYLLDPLWIYEVLDDMVQMADMDIINGIVDTDFLLRSCNVPVAADILPVLLLLLSKLELALKVDKDLLLIPTLLADSVSYPDPIFVSFTKKAYDIYKPTKVAWESSASVENSDSVEAKREHINDVSTWLLGKLDGKQQKRRPRMSSSEDDDYLELKKDWVASQDPFPHFGSIKSLTSPRTSYVQNESMAKSQQDFVDINLLYHPVLSRIWLAHFIPEGFWPRLLSRIASDLEIDAIFTALFQISLKHRKAGELQSLSRTDVDGYSLWNLWKTGLAFVHEGMLMLELKQVINTPLEFTLNNQKSIAEKFRIELAIHVSGINMIHHHSHTSLLSNNELVGLCTKLLVLVEQHVIDVGEEWYSGILSKTSSEDICSYVMCSECLANQAHQYDPDFTKCRSIPMNGEEMFCFPFEELLKSFYYSKPAKCPYHQPILIQLLAPDIMFRDLKDVICGSNIPLTIDKDIVLGKGGTALVLKGELNYPRQPVAVKIICDGVIPTEQIDYYVKNQVISLSSYQQVRKEVAISTKLNHRNLTQLCGMFTNPLMMLMELAPMGSLSTVLKEYRAADALVVPSVLRNSINQIASGMSFLHKKRIAYLDLKTDNVLVWEYPLPNSLLHKQYAPPRVRLKITDYGISRIYSSSDQIIRHRSVAGTSGYIAPEVLNSALMFDLQAEKIDVFAFAMTIYQLLTLYRPYELLLDIDSNIKCNDVVSRNERPAISGKGKWVPYLMQKMMIQCWDHDSHKRPTMAQIKEWSVLPEFPILRTVFRLKPGRLSTVCQCLVDRYHVHPYSADQASTNTSALLPTTNDNLLPSTEEKLFSPLRVSSFAAPSLLHRRKADQHNQVWITQETDIEDTSQLSIITYRSGELGYRSFHATLNTSRVTAMLGVNNYLWIATLEHKLFIIHAPSMQTAACVPLVNSDQHVLDLLYVAQWRTVLVMWSSAEVWYLSEVMDPSGGIHVLDKQQLDGCGPLAGWCKVVLQDKGEVWATQGDNKVVVLKWYRPGYHRCVQLQTATSDRLVCDHITSTNVSENIFNKQVQVWVSFKNSSKLTCTCAATKTPLFSIRLPETGNHCYVSCLLGHCGQVYVGTSLGTVVILDAKNGQVVSKFSLHDNKVNVLLDLPLQVKPCICAELPTEKPGLTSTKSYKPERKSLPAVPLDSEEENSSSKPKKRGTSVVTKPEVDSSTSSCNSSSSNHSQQPLFISVGDGRANYFSNTTDTSQDQHLLTWTGDYV